MTLLDNSIIYYSRRESNKMRHSGACFYFRNLRININKSNYLSVENDLNPLANALF